MLKNWLTRSSTNKVGLIWEFTFYSLLHKFSDIRVAIHTINKFAICLETYVYVFVYWMLRASFHEILNRPHPLWPKTNTSAFACVSSSPPSNEDSTELKLETKLVSRPLRTFATMQRQLSTRMRRSVIVIDVLFLWSKKGVTSQARKPNRIW